MFQDELLCASDRVPLHIWDLLGWLADGTENEANWEAGTMALRSVPQTEKGREEGTKQRNVPLHAKFDTTNCGLHMADVEKERNMLGEWSSEVLFLLKDQCN